MKVTDYILIALAVIGTGAVLWLFWKLIIILRELWRFANTEDDQEIECKQ